MRRGDCGGLQLPGAIQVHRPRHRDVRGSAQRDVHQDGAERAALVLRGQEDVLGAAPAAQWLLLRYLLPDRCAQSLPKLLQVTSGGWTCSRVAIMPRCAM